jgi:hypothetical protein
MPFLLPLLPPLLLLMLLPLTAAAGDSVAGMALFNNVPDAIISCGNSSCHGPNPNDNVNRLQKAGNNAGVIEAAIRVNVPPMMFLNGLLNPFQLDDLAAYLAPQPDLADTSIAFGAQPLATPSPKRSVTLRNLGGVDLALTDVVLSGPDVASFSVGGSCRAASSLRSVTIDRPGGSCTFDVVFTPSSARSQQATLTVSYAGTTTFPSRQAIALSGVGNAPAIAAISLDTSAVEFGEVLAQASAQSRTVTVANPGTAPLSLIAIETGSVNGAEFGVSGTCVNAIFNAPVRVAPAGSCTIVVSFSPQAVGSRNAVLTIRHDVGGGVSTVSLHGVGTSAGCQLPEPAADFQTLSCPAGQTGMLTQSRSYACSGTAWTPGPFTTVANNCRAEGPAAPLLLIEYYNALLDHYFITADPAERAAIDSGLAGPGWERIGLLGHVWNSVTANVAGTAETAAICRFYGNPQTGADGHRLGPNSHFYSADTNECDTVKHDPGWVFEGVVFGAMKASGGTCAPPLVAVRRSYNQRYRENDSNHRYSIDPALAAQMSARGWVDEGVVFCIER